jgi:hypothetical protein
MHLALMLDGQRRDLGIPDQVRRRAEFSQEAERDLEVPRPRRGETHVRHGHNS